MAVAAPAWVAGWVGVEFEERGRGPRYDCWGAVRAILAEHAGIDLPDFGPRGPMDKAWIGEFRRWATVPVPQPLDLVLMVYAGRPQHIGIMVSAEHLFHVDQDAGGLCQRLGAVKHPIEGFYRRA